MGATSKVARWLPGIDLVRNYRPNGSPTTLSPDSPLPLSRSRSVSRMHNSPDSRRLSASTHAFYLSLRTRCSFRLWGRSFTPYGPAEAFYDTRFDVWNRNRLTAGSEFQLKRGFPCCAN